MSGTADEPEREKTKFEMIANRLDNARSRLVNVTQNVSNVADAIDGSEPPLTEQKGKEDGSGSPGNSITSGLYILLAELEDQINTLEHEQNRLSKIFF